MVGDLSLAGALSLLRVALRACCCYPVACLLPAGGGRLLAFADRWRSPAVGVRRPLAFAGRRRWPTPTATGCWRGPAAGREPLVAVIWAACPRDGLGGRRPALGGHHGGPNEGNAGLASAAAAVQPGLSSGESRRFCDCGSSTAPFAVDDPRCCPARRNALRWGSRIADGSGTIRASRRRILETLRYTERKHA